MKGTGGERKSLESCGSHSVVIVTYSDFCENIDVYFCMIENDIKERWTKEEAVVNGEARIVERKNLQRDIDSRGR